MSNAASQNADKKSFIFAGLTEKQRKSMKMDDVALYSVSSTDNADSVSDLMLSLLPQGSDSVITDGCCCVGGNTMSFAKKFKVYSSSKKEQVTTVSSKQAVNAVELDDTRFEYLQHNLSALGLTSTCLKYFVDGWIYVFLHFRGGFFFAFMSFFRCEMSSR